MKNLFNSWLATQYIAHRGLHSDTVPENSLLAFKLAMENNHPFEMDVQMTLDGVLVVFHDRSLLRMTGVDKFIDQVNYEEIKDLKLLKTDEHIPTMQEMLDFVDGKVPILVEIKTHETIGELEEKLTKMLRAYKGEFAVQSFNPFIVKWFKKNAKEFIRGQLSCSFAWEKDMKSTTKYLLRHLAFIGMNGSQFVSYDVNDIHRPQLKRIKKRMPVLMWTTRSKEEMEQNKDYYTNIIFEKFKP